MNLTSIWPMINPRLLMQVAALNVAVHISGVPMSRKQVQDAIEELRSVDVYLDAGARA